MDQRLRVLIVEDSEHDALLIQRALRTGGYEPACRRVETGEAMRDALHDAPWDVIIADCALPHFDARAALHLLRDSGLDIPFIVVSGSVGEDMAVAMLREGAHDYVMKGHLARLPPAVERELREARQRRRHREAEEALRQSEARLRAIFEAAENVSFITTDLAGADARITEFSPGAERLFGYSRDEVIGKPVAMLHLPEDVARFARIIESMRQRKAGFHGETTLVRKSGGKFPALFTTYPLCGASGDMVATLGVSIDISERKRAEQALQESEQKYRGVVDNIPIAVSVISPAMEILALNREMRRRFPHVDPSKKPRCYRSFHHPPRDGVCPNCPTCKTLDTGQVHESVVERRVESETRSYRIVSSPLRDAAGNVVAAIEMVEDITDRKRAEEAMLRAGKLDSLALLAGGIAHDFNNILTGVIGNVSLALLTTTSTGTVVEALRQAERACRQAMHLTHQLLTFAKGGAPVRTTSSLRELIRDSSELALRGSRVRCDLDIADKLWPADIDEGQISQAISNLVINAHQAMPDGGTITVRAQNVPVGADRYPALGHGRYVEVSVQDEGVGIPPRHLDRIFDPYFTTKQTGSGLGLATTYSIIRQHGGAIAVQSEQGVGTTFHLYLPASDRLPSPEKRPDDDLGTGTGRVLLMDDEQIVRDVAARMLEHLGYDIQLAEDGAEAIAMYQRAAESGQPFDAVILDLTVPGGTGGKEALRELLRIDSHAKAIASSGYSTDPVMADFQEHGFAAVVPKPYQIHDLARALQAVSAGDDGGAGVPQ